MMAKGKTEANAWYIAAVVLVMLILAFVNYRQFAALRTTQRELQMAEEDLSQSANLLASRVVLSQRAEEMEEALAAAERFMPGEPREGEVITALQFGADLAGVTLDTLQFGARIDKETYVEMPVNMNLEGAYHPLLDLMEHLAESERALRIDEIRIGSVRESPPRMTINIRGSVFHAGE